MSRFTSGGHGAAEPRANDFAAKEGQSAGRARPGRPGAGAGADQEGENGAAEKAQPCHEGEQGAEEATTYNNR